MRHARKVRIAGQDWKYYVTNRVVHSDDPYCFRQVTLYDPSGKEYYWTFQERKLLSPAMVKEAWERRKFYARPKNNNPLKYSKGDVKVKVLFYCS